jgi:hypothetical protein
VRSIGVGATVPGEMTAKEQLLDRAPGFSEAQARAALTAAERLQSAGTALQAIGEAFSDVDPAEIETEAVRAVKEARAELAAERHA